jgi:hypothetical protein
MSGQTSYLKHIKNLELASLRASNLETALILNSMTKEGSNAIGGKAGLWHRQSIRIPMIIQKTGTSSKFCVRARTAAPHRRQCSRMGFWLDAVGTGGDRVFLGTHPLSSLSYFSSYAGLLFQKEPSFFP